MKVDAPEKRWVILLFSAVMGVLLPLSSIAALDQSTNDTPAVHSSATDIAVPSVKAGKVVHKKTGLNTGVPPAALIANEKYANMGPGGSPTPQCPRYFGCPDINKRLSGEKTRLDNTLFQQNCPDFCLANRTGDLSGTYMAVCPAGYAQIGMFNAQQEWVPNPSGEVTYTVVDVIDRQNPTSAATFMKYWNDPAHYDCHPYTGLGSEPIVHISERPSKYVKAVCVSWAGGKDCGPFCNDMPWKRNAFGEWSYVEPSGFENTPQWYPYLPLMNFLTTRPNAPFSMPVIDEATYGLSGIFKGIRANGRMPVTWCGQSNQRNKPVPICATKSTGGNPIYYEKFTVPTYSYMASPSDTTKTEVPGYDQLLTYADADCTTVAMKNSVCGIPLTYPDEEPDTPALAAGGSCSNIYFRVLVPVYEMTCKKRSGTLKASPAGYDTPVSILCGRVKPQWQ